MTPTPFTLYPAIDLRHGRVVRLQYGDPSRQTTYGDDPVATAQRWLTAGARWLHVVNLDGAFDEAGAANWSVLPNLAALDATLQFGGGLRSLDDIARALDLGVTRIILGTVAVENPDLVATAVDRFGAAAIAVGLDARDNRIRTRGWQDDGGVTAVDLGRRMRSLGVTTAIHTDIGRDGVLTGVNAAASVALARATGLHVIASGGVASLADIQAVLNHTADGVTGVIAGRALYENTLDLPTALTLINNHETPYLSS